MPTANISRALSARHPLDTPRIRAVAQLAHGKPLTDCEVERLWEEFSSEFAREHWLMVDVGSLGMFEEWCRQ